MKLVTNHNNWTQVCKTVDQSQQSDSGMSDSQPITTSDSDITTGNTTDKCKLICSLQDNVNVASKLYIRAITL